MNYNNITPAGSFIHSYMQHMSEQETATAYDFWCAMWMISCAVGRDIIVDRPRAPVYLNLYTVLVAESGVTRKSSAVRSTMSIVNAFVERTAAFTVVEGKTTPEKLEQILHERTTDFGSARSAIGISELAAFLGTDKYTQGMPIILTDLYDCPSHRKSGGTVARGNVVLQDCWVNFLSASTPTWLFRSVNPGVVQGGFTSRCLFIIQEKPKRLVAWPTNIDASQDTQEAMVQILEEFRSKALSYSTLTINDTAKQLFTKWYTGRTHRVDPFSASFESREDAHILRCAALLCINDGAWVIQKAHIQHAIKLIAHVKETSVQLFEQSNARTKWTIGVVALRDKLIRAGTDPVPRTQLYLACRKNLDNAEFAALLDVMHEMQVIQRFEVRKSRGRPIELIRGTTLLMKKDFVEQLNQSMGQL